MKPPYWRDLISFTDSGFIQLSLFNAVFFNFDGNYSKLSSFEFAGLLGFLS